jgi:Transposase zinc-ribbon domain
MVELPRSLPEFEARFPDEAACARWLLAKRWPGGVRCPACGHTKDWELGRERLTLQCAACERQVSVTAGTRPEPVTHRDQQRGGRHHPPITDQDRARPEAAHGGEPS